MKKRLCDFCDVPLMPDYEYDLCPDCCEMMRAAIKEEPKRVIVPDVDSKIVN